MSYTFRIRLNRSPRCTIQTDTSLIDLPVPEAGLSLSLRASTPKKSLKDAERWALIGGGFRSDGEAWEAAARVQDALLLALAKIRLGADFGDRAPKGALTADGIAYCEAQTKKRIMNDVHGISVYSADPKPSFFRWEARGVRGINDNLFKDAFLEAIKQGLTLSDRERVSLSLFHASFFQPTEDSRFLLLVMAVEALIELLPKSLQAHQRIDEFMQQIRTSPLDSSEKESLLTSLCWMKKESIRQAGRRLVISRLGEKTYRDKPAAKFFSYVYDLRSKLVHGRPPEFEEIHGVVGIMEVFVSELLTAPLMGTLSPEK